MSKITNIELQKSSYAKASERRGIRRFNIYLDGNFAFGADEDLIVNFRLTVGKEISKEDLNKLLSEAVVGKWMEKMYRWFGMRMRSEKEVKDYFRIKNQELIIKEKEEISQLVINTVIEKLKQKEIINDLEFTKAWVEARRKSKQKSIKALKMELYQKGIDREIVEGAISIQPSAVSEEELAKITLEKKKRSWKNLPTQEFKKKAYEYLLRRGFEYEVIKKIVSELF